MQRNSYQIFKEEITNILEQKPKPLFENQIEDAVDSFKKIQEDAGLLNFFAMKYELSNLKKLDEKQWSRMIRELETDYDVRTNMGIIVTGEQQKERDSTWWSHKQKLAQENYYNENYKKYMSSSLPNDVIKNTDEDTDIVMNYLGNPNQEQFERYGMVVGHVQSGKTGNYSSLVCKAADAGYKFIVVIAGAMNNLRNQTQERLNASFIGRDLNERVGVAKLANYREDKRPISLTSKTKDFNKADADRNSQGISLDSISSPVIVVIKKNTRTLDNVISWIENHYSSGVNKHAMLLIDDESDYASINTKEEEDPTKINEKIRALLKLFKKSSYVAYTATPYANIFIDHNTDTESLGKDLFPEDFIYCLNAPSNYLGAEKIFMDKNQSYFYDVDDAADIIPPKHKKDYELPELPDSLKDAVRLFLVNIAIRHLRDQENKHNSMLVHASRFTNVHKNIASNINEYHEKLKQALESDGKKDNSSSINEVICDIKNTFEYHYKDKIEFEWNKIIFKITDIISKVQIFEVHKDTKLKLEYRDDVASNVIVIGGTSLARGYTLEGLSISYFLRTTIFYDTLMQMGRWFGYRMGYEDLCKIYTTQDTFDKFKTITEATLDLVDDLKEMSENEMTPRDFGLAVKQHPDSGLQVTAKNKLKNSGSIDFEMKLDGHLKETSWILKETSVNQRNIELIRSFVKKIMKENYIQPKERYWIDIPKELILKFVSDFNVYEAPLDDLGMKSKMPIKFIKKYIEQVNSLWDVAIYSGNSLKKLNIDGINASYQERKVTDRGKYFEVEHRQVSSGNAENISISVETLNQIKKMKKINTEKKKKEKEKGKQDIENTITNYSVRKAVRNKMVKPLLMLHIIDAEVKKKTIENKNERLELAAFGISFPGGIQSTYGNVKLQVNTVYLQQMMEDEDYDDY